MRRQTLITDGYTQSSQFDEFAYHESLVHPALLLMAASGRPAKTVFIGGGGELATAREVLRHASVTRVVMVDLDEKVVKLCQEYLPEWGGDAVANHPRLELIFGDAYAYLMETTEIFDVIIMDISDPVEAGPGIALYTKEFYQHAVTRLSPGGAFVTQSGTADSIPFTVYSAEGKDHMSFAPIYNTLASVFGEALPYSVNIPSFGGDWGFNMAFAPIPDECGKGEANSVLDWKQPSAGVVDSLIESQIQGGARVMKFYDGESHRRMFALPKPLRLYLAMDDRIMTKANPIYMF
jgi:spermidine synthase